MTQNSIVSIYSEATPNPDTMKFVLNRLLFAHQSADFPTEEEAAIASPLAAALFHNFPYVNGVFIMNNFLTITKKTEQEWFELIPDLREFIRNYIANGGEIVDESLLQEKLAANSSAGANAIHENDDEVVRKIKEIIAKYVQPAVEMDGGTIVYRDFVAGVVTLGMQGSCSGCPSSTITLKSGIEGLLKRMVPEVSSVEAEAM